MGSHPINLLLRFLLELCVLAVAGYWGWSVSSGFTRFLLVWGVPLLLAILWGTFSVPDDPSRSGRAPIPVPGVLRLLLELINFGFGVWALYSLGHGVAGLVLAVLVVVHNILSYDRITWLVRQPGRAARGVERG
jgi:hypothetical protein